MDSIIRKDRNSTQCIGGTYKKHILNYLKKQHIVIVACTDLRGYLKSHLTIAKIYGTVHLKECIFSFIKSFLYFLNSRDNIMRLPSKSTQEKIDYDNKPDARLLEAKILAILFPESKHSFDLQWLTDASRCLLL